MRTILQRDTLENCSAAVSNLLLSLDVKVSKRSLKKIKLRAGYPSLLCMSEFLTEWNVRTLAIEIDRHKLSDIPYPAIAHLRKNNGHFVVLLSLQYETLTYVDPEIGLVKESLNEFEKKWSGVALLVSVDEKSGEENYEEKKNTELVEHVSRVVCIGLVGFTVLLSMVLISPSMLVFFFIKVMGTALCVLLLLKQFGSTSEIISLACHLGKDSSCDAVIHSRAAKLFGVFYMSEVGLLYFAGALIGLSFSVIVTQSQVGPLIVMNWLALPYTLFSIYYQWRVIKRWCPICLAVMVVFWLEFFVCYPFDLRSELSWSSAFIFFLSFSFPLIFWLAVRRRLIESIKVPSLELVMNRFLKSERIFDLLLTAQPTTNMGSPIHEITVGPFNAPVELTIVTSGL